MTRTWLDRRQFLAATVTAGVAGVAGCSSHGGEITEAGKNAFESNPVSEGLDEPVYVRRVVFGGDRTVVSRLLAMGALFPLVGASESLLRDTLIYTTAAAVGTNLAVLGRHLRRDSVRLREGSSGLVGVVIGTLGAGCAPCGAAVLAGTLSVTGVATGLAALPLKGAEFLVVALAASVLSLFWIADGTAAADVDGCPVDA